MRKTLVAVLLLCGIVGTPRPAAADGYLTLREWVGKQIFFDENLSINRNQACAACHTRAVGWTGADPRINRHGAVYEGSIPGAFGNRKPPTAAYSPFAPRLRYDDETDTFIGGEFWDGRATGWKLGNPAADQAQGPFLNPVEQALPNAAAVVDRVCRAWYGFFFRVAWGNKACKDVERSYDDVARSIAAYEGSPDVSAFSSKYDAYLAGWAHLSKREGRGLALFEGKAGCNGCHVLDLGQDGDPPLLTDFTYDNIGVPKNPDNPVYKTNPSFIDPGLGGFLATLVGSNAWRSLPFVSHSVAKLTDATLQTLAETNYGKQRVPTLRNVAKGLHEHAKAYMHNGFFKTLHGIVHFYNTRDVLPTCPAGVTTEAAALANDCWPPPEVMQNEDTQEMGNLGLTEDEEDSIVAFLGTLSDGYGH